MKNLFKYVFNGNKISRRTFRRKFTFHFKLLLYIIVSFMMKLTLVLYPITLLTDYRLVKEIEETNNFKVSNLFKDFNDSKFVWKNYVIGGLRITLITTITYLFYKLGIYFFKLGLLIDDSLIIDVYLTTITFLTILIVLYLIIIFNILIRLSLTSYISINENHSIDQTIDNGFSKIDKRDTTEYFFVYLLNVLYLVIFGIIGLLVRDQLINYFSQDYEIVSNYLFIVFCIILIIRLYNQLSLSNYLFIKDLFKKEIKVIKEEEVSTLTHQEELKELFNKSSGGE